jgi:hypothetical protein
MKYIAVLLVCLLNLLTAAQEKDTRAVVPLHGRSALSFSPAGFLCAVSEAGAYYSVSADSNWHVGKILGSDKANTDNTYQHINFFNKDTAILTGYITFHDSKSKSGVYITTNAGKSWSNFSFGGDSWIYDVYSDSCGKAWMGGSSGCIYYSENFGTTWTMLNSPYNSITRMAAIFMRNPAEGISGALTNLMYGTRDNWKTYYKIVTPHDQKKIIPRDHTSGYRINKILLWKNFIVVTQEKECFILIHHESIGKDLVRILWILCLIQVTTNLSQ